MHPLMKGSTYLVLLTHLADQEALDEGDTVGGEDHKEQVAIGRVEQAWSQARFQKKMTKRRVLLRQYHDRFVIQKVLQRQCSGRFDIHYLMKFYIHCRSFH